MNALPGRTMSRTVAVKWLTVRAAGKALGISPSGVRRRIQDGRLRAEQVKRPQGMAYRVELPDTMLLTPHGEANDTSAERQRTPSPGLESPTARAANQVARTLLEPLVGIIDDQQAQLIDQSEAIARLAAEVETLKAFTAEQDAILRRLMRQT